MKKLVIPTGIAFSIIILLGICTLVAIPELSAIKNSPTQYTNNNKDPDILVFISPQYSNDEEIKVSINNYATAVKEDINWNIKIIPLTQNQNDYTKIDEIIEEHYEQNEIKACIMVGEDIDTALGGSNSYMKKPSTVPWETIGGEDSYEQSIHGIVCKPYQIKICISLIYPTSDQDFFTKKQQIINAFNKFSSQRKIRLDKQILAFESSDINTNSKEIYNSIGNYGNLYYKQDPTDLEIEKSKTFSYSMYFVHGHSNPSGTDTAAGIDGWFSADYVDQIDTPLFGADGCYVGGWWTNQPDTNTLAPSISSTWYGSKIFTSKNIIVMVLGLLSQNGLSYPVSFIENAIPEILNGKTVAESVIGDTYIGDTTIIGDPTFHYD